MLNCLVVALGDGIGACLRYLIGLAVIYVALSVVVGVSLAFAGQVIVGK